MSSTEPLIYIVRHFQENGDPVQNHRFLLKLDLERRQEIAGGMYADAAWEHDAPPEQVMVLHTLVVSPREKGRGYGTRFVAFYERYALERGCPYLRMDTNAKNLAARALYRKLGYKEVSVLPCKFNGIPDVALVCLEKKLSAK